MVILNSFNCKMHQITNRSSHQSYSVLWESAQTGTHKSPVIGRVSNFRVTFTASRVKLFRVRSQVSYVVYASFFYSYACEYTVLCCVFGVMLCIFELCIVHFELCLLPRELNAQSTGFNFLGSFMLYLRIQSYALSFELCIVHLYLLAGELGSILTGLFGVYYTEQVNQTKTTFELIDN